MSPRRTNTLSAYRAKRPLARTPEPPGTAMPGGEAGRLLVVHKHAARCLPFDRRLEIEDGLRSWAVPKGLPDDPADKPLAVPAEDRLVLTRAECRAGRSAGGNLVLRHAGLIAVAPRAVP